MRIEDEVVRAHDILNQLVLDELPGVGFSREEDRRHLAVALDVLCWVLGHEQNESFATNLRGLTEAAEAAGYQLADLKQGGGC